MAGMNHHAWLFFFNSLWVAARKFLMPFVAGYVFPLGGAVGDLCFVCLDGLLTSLSSFFSSMAQTGLKKFLEYVQLGTSDKVARLLDKGLDPNYHDSDSGGRERLMPWKTTGARTGQQG
jgi:hypothetical protein